MDDAHNDNGSKSGARVLEARFHPTGHVDEFIVVGQIFCFPAWALLEVAFDFGCRLPDKCSASSVISNLTYLTIMSRPCPFEQLLSLDNRYWSFVATESPFDQASH